MGANKTNSQTYSADPDTTYNALIKAVNAINRLNISSEDKANRTVELTTPVSIRSLGEKVTVTVTEHEGGSMVTVDSSSKMAVVDWGKNQTNIDSIFRELGKLLNA